MLTFGHCKVRRSQTRWRLLRAHQRSTTIVFKTSIKLETTMMHKLLAAALAACLVADAGAAIAATKHRVRDTHIPRHARLAPPIARPGEPARMIEARPGVFISSYDCITDEGYGRWRPCSTGGRDGP